MTEDRHRDAKTGRFISGNLGGGRKPGSRSKLAESFIADLHRARQRYGPEVLDKLAQDAPATFARLAVKLVPKEFTHKTYSDSMGGCDPFERRLPERTLRESAGSLVA